jgi:hypothetical protein
MTLRHYIPRIILSPLIFSAATFASIAMFLFPWWLVIGMHLIMFLYEMLRLPSNMMGVEMPKGDEPLIQPFHNNLFDNLAAVFIPIIFPFYVTYIFITQGKVII